MAAEYTYDYEGDHWFTVKIEQPGPRGGKRPPLIHIRLRADSYNEAVMRAKNKFFTRTDITVKW